MFCPKCGTQTLPNANFCERCGANLNNIITPTAASTPADSISPSVRFGNISPHPDVLPLLWFADGNLRNIDVKQASFQSREESEYITVTTYGPEEPSALYSKLPIRKPFREVERPPYYPSYSSLSPEQRYLYLSFLADPYGCHDIGYVFIFYYGLERQLLTGKFEQAFDVILKLRDVYDNKSFQLYSASALILTSIYRERPDKLKDFLLSLDKPYELNIMPELYILTKSLFNESLTAAELMHFSNHFGFTNKRYIKSYPELFEECLKNTLNELEHKDVLAIPKIKSLRPGAPIFANYSLNDVRVHVPDYFSSKRFVGKGYMLLTTAHNQCKEKLATMRKQKQQ